MARDLTLIDQLVTVLSAAWGPISPDAVSREYVAPVTEKDLHTLTGRKVYLFPTAYESVDENRSENLYGYHVEACVIERYEAADKATSAALKTWLDARLQFVEQYLIDGFDFGQGNTSLIFGTPQRKVWTDSIEVAIRYDHDYLIEKKCFRSNLGFVFREFA